MDLHGKHVALLVTPRDQDMACIDGPRRSLERAGASVTVFRLGSGATATDTTARDRIGPGELNALVAALHAEDFQAVVIADGHDDGARERTDTRITQLVMRLAATGRRVNAASQGQWVMIQPLAH